MSEESVETNAASNSEKTRIDAQAVADKVNVYGGKVDAFIEKLLGIIGGRPWQAWLDSANKRIGMFLPAVIAVSGLLAFVIGLVSSIKNDAPVSRLMTQFLWLFGTVFSMHLAPKALALASSFVSKGEPEAMRPELLYIGKVVLGLGGLVLAVGSLLQFNGAAFVRALIAAAVAVLMIIICSNPSLIGVKPGYPTNAVEECLTILLVPVRFVLSLLSVLIGVGSVCGLVYGIVTVFTYGPLLASMVFGGTALVPLVLPLAVYCGYLLAMFVLDLYRAIVCIPRKLDDVRRAIEEKR